MPKVTLDRETFKALASDTRLEILRTLDGKNLGLKEISKATNLNKATLHEHLTKLHEAGLVKRKEREGHKWVYYKLTWKGESLLHPENTRIVVLFSVAFIALCTGVIQFLWYLKSRFLISFDKSYDIRQYFAGMDEESGDLANRTMAYNNTIPYEGLDPVLENGKLIIGQFNGGVDILYQNPLLLYIAIACFIIFSIVSMVFLWRFWVNRKPKL